MISPKLFCNIANIYLEAVRCDSDQRGFAPGYADDFTLISHSPAWLQAQLDRFAKFASDFGFSVNVKPSKTCILFSCTYKYLTDALSCASLPQFEIDGHPIAYTKSKTYLGFKLNQALDDVDHVKHTMSSLRKRIFAFTNRVKTGSASLRLRLIRTYVLSGFYGIEFINKIPKSTVARYYYLISILLRKPTNTLQSIIEKNPWLNLQNILLCAAQRLQNLHSPLKNAPTSIEAQGGR